MNRRYGILLLAVAVLALSWAHDVSAQTKPSHGKNPHPRASPRPVGEGRRTH
jgi:hypothetical protein